MDGVQGRLSESIQFRLSLGLSVAILLVAVVAGGFAFATALHDAHELQDDMLRQVARLVTRQGGTPAASAGPAAGRRDGDDASRVIVQFLGVDGRDSLPGSAAVRPVAFAQTLADGLQDVSVGGESYRAMVVTAPASVRFVVAQASDFRDDIASDGAFRAVVPLLVLVPVLLAVVADRVRRMFRPIAALATAIDRRAEHDLQPVDATCLPREVRPFAAAINRLLARVGQTLDAQRRFVVDAAHELRSPLTALSLQVEGLASLELPDPARDQVVTLRRGIERGRHLLEQLLALARLQAAASAATSRLSVRDVVRHVLEDLMPLAEAKRVDVGIERTCDATLLGAEPDLLAIVRNLVDNAIRYAPDGGRVDISVGVEQGRAVLRVRDDGPGIPASERERVFDAFYRVLGSGQAGSGLGLSIVRAAADRMDAEIRLGAARPGTGSGLEVAVVLPAGTVVSERHRVGSTRAPSVVRFIAGLRDERERSKGKVAFE